MECQGTREKGDEAVYMTTVINPECLEQGRVIREGSGIMKKESGPWILPEE